MPLQPTRRSALKTMASAFAAPTVFRSFAAHAAPNETLLHASFGGGGMALADLGSLSASKNLKLVAVADVDTSRFAPLVKRFPDLRVYQDWRELLDKEKELHSANISTPDHMHAPITMRCLQRGLHVYTQKPLTQTIYEARQLTRMAADKKIVSQMGIQIHSNEIHLTVVAMIQGGAIGKVRDVHSWSSKTWGDRGALPERKDPIPGSLNWDHWLGVAADRPYIRDVYHPGQWRKRLDFGTGTFGDMGCHILDPVFSSLALTTPRTVQSLTRWAVPNATNWGLDCQVQYVFPGTKFTADSVTLNWYDGSQRPPVAIRDLIGKRGLHDQGSIYIGSEGVLYSPYIAAPVLLPEEKFRDYKRPTARGTSHYLQFVEACRGNGQTSTPFSYSGPLTESILLGCLSTRFERTILEWNAADMTIRNSKEANEFVRRRYRRGWEVEGL